MCIWPVIIRDCHAPPSDVSSDVKTASLMSYEAVYSMTQCVMEAEVNKTYDNQCLSFGNAILEMLGVKFSPEILTP